MSISIEQIHKILEADKSIERLVSSTEKIVGLTPPAIDPTVMAAMHKASMETALAPVHEAVRESIASLQTAAAPIIAGQGALTASLRAVVNDAIAINASHFGRIAGGEKLASLGLMVNIAEVRGASLQQAWASVERASARPAWLTRPEMAWTTTLKELEVLGLVDTKRSAIQILGAEFAQQTSLLAGGDRVFASLARSMGYAARSFDFVSKGEYAAQVAAVVGEAVAGYGRYPEQAFQYDSIPRAVAPNPPRARVPDQVREEKPPTYSPMVAVSGNNQQGASFSISGNIANGNICITNNYTLPSTVEVIVCIEQQGRPVEVLRWETPACYEPEVGSLLDLRGHPLIGREVIIARLTRAPTRFIQLPDGQWRGEGLTVRVFVSPLSLPTA
jgi:hypothetical protein